MYILQGDQKVSGHMFLYFNHEVHRDFMIALYNLRSVIKECKIDFEFYICGSEHHAL